MAARMPLRVEPAARFLAPDEVDVLRRQVEGLLVERGERPVDAEHDAPGLLEGLGLSLGLPGLLLMLNEELHVMAREDRGPAGDQGLELELEEPQPQGRLPLLLKSGAQQRPYVCESEACLGGWIPHFDGREARRVHPPQSLLRPGRIGTVEVEGEVVAGAVHPVAPERPRDERVHVSRIILDPGGGKTAQARGAFRPGEDLRDRRRDQRPERGEQPSRMVMHGERLA